MKKLWILVVAFCVTLSMAAVAQEMGKSCDMGKGKAASAPLKTLKGTVRPRVTKSPSSAMPIKKAGTS